MEADQVGIRLIQRFFLDRAKLSKIKNKNCVLPYYVVCLLCVQCHMQSAYRVEVDERRSHNLAVQSWSLRDKAAYKTDIEEGDNRL